MSRPVKHIEKAIEQVTIGRNGWAIAAGCRDGCECTACWNLNFGLERLSMALAEMKAVEE